MKSTRRLLHVISAIGRGGAENHLLDLVAHQCREGWAVTIAYLKPEHYWAARLRELGAEVQCVELQRYGEIRPVLRLRRLIAQGGFDLIHTHLPPAELYVRLALLRLPGPEIPLVISKHNDCHFHERLPLMRPLARWVARRAQKVIAISEAVRRFMIGPEVRLPAAQVETIHYGADPRPYEKVSAEAVAALRAQWGLTQPNQIAIGFVGRLVEQKDLPTLLRAYAAFKSLHPSVSRLVFVGGGPREAELRKYSADLGFTDGEVIWAGFRDDVPVVMNAFDVFALTSVYEGFGLVLLEAMAAGKPIVATRAGAIPEVVVDGGTGFLTATGDDVALREAFEKLLDPTVRVRLGEAGRRRAAECFTLDGMCRATDDLYARCLGPASPMKTTTSPCAASTAS